LSKLYCTVIEQASLGETYPNEQGDFRMVHTRFSRWAKRGVWQWVFEQLATDADNEYAMIDSTIVRAHQHSAGAKGGMHRAKPLVAALGGLSTKIHTLVDALGNPLGFHLTPGQTCDLDGADVLLNELTADTLLADKGYDADERGKRATPATGEDGSDSAQAPSYSSS
jgi:transposase